ncbi:MAG: 5-methyltetrahydropteroyltriglutamate--homocysteine S-methyltransferase [Alphaproteobacteria bacterium]
MADRPPYRADQVGSLLRPQAVKDARAAREAGTLDAAGLRAVEDAAIRDAVAHQCRVGLTGVTDGEFRRAFWHFDFLGQLEGVELRQGERAIQFHGIQTKAVSIAVTGKVGFGDHPMLADFRFLKQAADAHGAVAKMTIPAPSVLHFRGGRASISKDAYPDMDAFFADTAEAYAQAVRAFYDAGCRYLQFDDTVWAYLCSEKEREAARARGDDPEPLQIAYRDMIRHALAAKPADMTITTHVCRGNFRSSWISEGGYEPVAEVLLGQTGYDGFFLEYDTERAGGFEPLRFLAKGDQRVVLGLVTSKFGELEAEGAIEARIEEATKYVALDQLCLSPQCGFASTEEGNILSEDDQWAKLALVTATAKTVWGAA